MSKPAVTPQSQIGQITRPLESIAIDQDTREKVIRCMATLTLRESTVLRLLLVGSSSREIAEELGISPKTADVHRMNIIRKMGAKNTVHLVFLVMASSPRRLLLR